jgi:hypothetical protein
VDVAVWSFGQEGRLPHVLQHQARIDQANKGYLSVNMTSMVMILFWIKINTPSDPYYLSPI